jgi:hypothetical protein
MHIPIIPIVSTDHLSLVHTVQVKILQTLQVKQMNLRLPPVQKWTKYVLIMIQNHPWIDCMLIPREILPRLENLRLSRCTVDRSHRTYVGSSQRMPVTCLCGPQRAPHWASPRSQSLSPAHARAGNTLPWSLSPSRMSLSPMGTTTVGEGSSPPSQAHHVSPPGSPGPSSGSSAAPTANPPPPPPVQAPRTHLQQGICNPKIYTDGTIRYGMFKSTREPSKLLEALEDDRWCKAMPEEYDALMHKKPGIWFLLIQRRIS